MALVSVRQRAWNSQLGLLLVRSALRDISTPSGQII
jgi:hypothetical protein